MSFDGFFFCVVLTEFKIEFSKYSINNLNVSIMLFAELRVLAGGMHYGCKGFSQIRAVPRIYVVRVAGAQLSSAKPQMLEYTRQILSLVLK